MSGVGLVLFWWLVFSFCFFFAAALAFFSPSWLVGWKGGWQTMIRGLRMT